MSYTFLGPKNKPRIIKVSLYAFLYQKGIKKIFVQNEKSEIQEVLLSRANIPNEVYEMIVFSVDNMRGSVGKAARLYRHQKSGSFKISKDAGSIQ